MPYALPVWEVGQTWQLKTTLSHLVLHPDPLQSRVIGVDNLWQCRVLVAPDGQSAGEIRVLLGAETAQANPFAGSRFELRFLREAEPARLHLASVWDGADRQLYRNGPHAFFRPGESLGMLFDMPQLLSTLEPSFGMRTLQPGAPFQEERVAYEGGMRFIFSHVFPPQGTTVRSTIEWDAGAVWYRRFLRERYNPADMIHTREIQASARLLV